MGVMDRANAGAGGGTGTGEPYLSKDELIRYRTPLAIVDVAYDRFGSATYRTPRWIVTVEAWDPNFPVPDSAYPADRDVEAQGLITFGDSEVRQSQFGTGRDEQGQPIGIAAQLEDAKAQGLEWIGPVAVVNGKSNKGSPFKTLADVSLDDLGNVVVDAQGFPVILGAPTSAPPRRQPAPTRAPAAAPAPPAAAPVQQARRSTGQRARAAAPATPPSVPGAAQAPSVVPPAQVPANTAPPRVSRRATAPATAPATPAPPAAAPTPPAAPRRRTAAQQAPPPPPPAASPEAYENAAQQAARRDPAATGPAPGVRELTEVNVDEATATCPFCSTEITGRLYPAAPDGFARAYGESARVFGWPELTPEQRAAGGQVIPHPHCPMLQQTVMLPYVQMED